MTDLFGTLAIPDVGSGAPLEAEFVEPPFSTLDRRSRRWRARGAKWRALGIRSEKGRPDELLRLSPGMHIKAREGGTSIFDPVVCELVYRWYTREGDYVLDPFAGGSVRGIVAACLGRSYLGIDLRPEQVEANRRQADEIATGDYRPQWVVGDADDLPGLCPEVQADLIFTCPPYHDLEVYSDDPADLSAMPWEDFEAVYRRVIDHAARALAPDRFMAIVVGDVRDRRGIYRGLPWLTIDAMRSAGVDLYQDAVLIDPHGSLQMIAPRTMRATRKLTRLHQYLIVGVKGDPRRAADRLTHPAPDRCGPTHARKDHQ